MQTDRDTKIRGEARPNTGNELCSQKHYRALYFPYVHATSIYPYDKFQLAISERFRYAENNGGEVHVENSLSHIASYP